MRRLDKLTKITTQEAKPVEKSKRATGKKKKGSKKGKKKKGGARTHFDEEDELGSEDSLNEFIAADDEEIL